jgi:hypothetical protein
MNTPRTDSAARRIDGFADEWVPRYVSEELERELQQANDYADRLVAHKDMVCLPADLKNLREANGHFAAENEELKKQRDRLAAAAAELLEHWEERISNTPERAKSGIGKCKRAQSSIDDHA